MAAQKAEGKRRWSGVPEMILHDKDGNDVQAMGMSNTCLRVIGMHFYSESDMLHAIYSFTFEFVQTQFEPK